MLTSAYINLWGTCVGAVSWDDKKSIGLFEFDPNFLRNNWEISPLKMPLSEAANKVFSFPELKSSNTFKGLPGLLADVLPDKYGTTLINTWLARNGRPTNSYNPVELLCFIGNRGMGALEFQPSQIQESKTASKLELDSLVNMAQEIVQGRKEFQTNLTIKEEKALLDVLKIGTSAGGARAKAIIAFNETTGEVRSGQTDAPKGFAHWLLKFDGVTDTQFGASYGYGRVEMAYHLMAKELGIQMMECRLLEENGRAHFMTKRFDRLNNKEKLHVQSFCALNHFDFNDIGFYSYEQLFESMRRLRLPYEDAEQLYKRMVFNVVMRNCDDHTKNFSFVMNLSGNWRLAPAFDMCHAYRPGSDWVSQHSLSINGKRTGITRDDLLSVAKKMNVKKAKAIIEQTTDIAGQWTKFAKEVGVGSDLKKAIQQTLLIL
jgi:serine/threonine-protein kinase HipA